MNIFFATAQTTNTDLKTTKFASSDLKFKDYEKSKKNDFFVACRFDIVLSVKNLERIKGLLSLRVAEERIFVSSFFVLNY